MSGGAADLDGRLQVGDEITHISGRSVMDASHREVIRLMGEAAAQGEVTLTIRRKMPMLGRLHWGSRGGSLEVKYIPIHF